MHLRLVGRLNTDLVPLERHGYFRSGVEYHGDPISPAVFWDSKVAPQLIRESPVSTNWEPSHSGVKVANLVTVAAPNRQGVLVLRCGGEKGEWPNRKQNGLAS